MNLKDKLKHYAGSPGIQLLFRLLLGGCFIYASIDKIANPMGFARIVFSYKLLPDFAINPVALFLPWIELIAGLFLVVGIFSRNAAIILVTLLGVFMIALGINAFRGIFGDCGCFTVKALRQGHVPGPGSNILTIFRDLLLLIPGFFIIFLGKKSSTAKSLKN